MNIVLASIENNCNLTLDYYLKENNLNLNIGRSSFDIPLIMAARRNQLNTLKILITYGANVNITDSKKSTALMESVFCNCLDSIKFLIDNDADVNLADIENKTMMHYCCIYGKYKILEYLLN